jgi:uncharacterized small protein (DUF1192 family)
VLWLDEEKSRAQAEIKRKQAVGSAAASFFKP